MSPPTRSCPVGRPGSIPISGPGGARAKGRGSTSYGVPSLYAGVYEIPTGGKDHQEPHRYDELYHVVSGQGVIQMDEEDREVGPGSVIFVRRKSRTASTESRTICPSGVLFAGRRIGDQLTGRVIRPSTR